MTKTPKLESAMRIVPEWSELDKEARSITVPEGNQRSISELHINLAKSVSESWTNLKTSITNPSEIHYDSLHHQHQHEDRFHHDDILMADVVEDIL